jgi:hypothetical protein
LVGGVDEVYLANYFFSGGPPPPSTWAADVNGDDIVNVSDMVYLANFFLAGGPEPNCLREIERRGHIER